MSHQMDLSPEFAQSLRKFEIDILYKTMDPAVWTLVDRLLSREGQEDKLIRQTHLHVSTPHLAVQAIKMNIGGDLPTFELEQKIYGGYRENGKTRTIEADDEFAVIGGPYTNWPLQGFTSVLHRASTLDQVDGSVQARLACNDFSNIPMLG